MCPDGPNDRRKMRVTNMKTWLSNAMCLFMNMGFYRYALKYECLCQSAWIHICVCRVHKFMGWRIVSVLSQLCSTSKLMYNMFYISLFVFNVLTCCERDGVRVALTFVFKYSCKGLLMSSYISCSYEIFLHVLTSVSP